MPYAQNTEVDEYRSRDEIQRVLDKYGAEQFAFGQDINKAFVTFRLNHRLIKFVIELPGRDDFKGPPTGRGRPKNPLKAYVTERRRRWRSLALSIKSKLIAVEDNISSFDEEFMAHIVLPNGKTVGENIGPTIEQIYLSGQMKALPMPGLSEE